MPQNGNNYNYIRIYLLSTKDLRRCVMSEFSHKCNIIRFHSMNFIIALTAWVCHAQILRKLDVYARIRKRCSDSFLKHVTACDCSLKKRDV